MANYQNLEVSEDTIFVTGLPDDTTEEQLGEFFGQIGVIKFDKRNQCPKIWIYKDKTTGKGKGEATITYDDPPTATSAISWFNGKEFRGSTLTIQLAQRKSAPQFMSRGGGRGGRGGFPRGEGRGGGPGGFDRGDRGDRGPRDGGGGGAGAGGRPSGPGRPGDWLCPSCSNNNFAYRQECNRCRAQKPAAAGGDGVSGGGSGGSSSGPGSGSHYNGGRHHDESNRGSYGGSRSGGSSNHRDNDLRDRSRDRPRDRDRERDRGDRSERDRNSRDQYGSGVSSGGGGGGSSSGGGPSRSHVRGQDDRRSRPY